MADQWSNNRRNPGGRGSGWQDSQQDYNNGYDDAVRDLGIPEPKFEHFDTSPSRDHNFAKDDIFLKRKGDEIDQAHKVFLQKDAELNDYIKYLRENRTQIQYTFDNPDTSNKYNLRKLEDSLNPRFEYPDFFEDKKYDAKTNTKQSTKIVRAKGILEGTNVHAMFHQDRVFKLPLMFSSFKDADFGIKGRLASYNLSLYYTDEMRLDRVYTQIAPKYDMLYLDDREKRMELDSLYLPDKYFDEKYPDQTANEKEHTQQFLQNKGNDVYNTRLNELACELCAKTAYNNPPFGDQSDYNMVVDYDWISQYLKIQEQASKTNNWQKVQPQIYQKLADITSQDVVDCGKFFVDQALIGMNKYHLDSPNFGKMVKSSLQLMGYPKDGSLYKTNGQFDNLQGIRDQYISDVAKYRVTDNRNPILQNHLWDLTVARFGEAVREHSLRVEYTHMKNVDDERSMFYNNPANDGRTYHAPELTTKLDVPDNHYDPNKEYFGDDDWNKDETWTYTPVHNESKVNKFFGKIHSFFKKDDESKMDHNEPEL